MNTRGPVVVGVDGSAGALGAVDLAARRAHERRLPLRIVHAFTWSVADEPLGPVPGIPAQGSRTAEADRILAEARARALGVSPGLSVHLVVTIAPAVTVLLAEAEDATITVVGRRGHGALPGLMLGSVSARVAAHARHPVVIACGAPDQTGDVVVGVDGSPVGSAAIGFAFQAASLAGCRLTLLHAYRYPVATGAGDMLPLVYDLAELAEEESAVLGEAIAGWRERFPDVPTRSMLVREGATRALLHAAERARLVVVGSRVHGAFPSLLLGSVSQAVIRHATRPVAVIPAAVPAIVH